MAANIQIEAQKLEILNWYIFKKANFTFSLTPHNDNHDCKYFNLAVFFTDNLTLWSDDTQFILKHGGAIQYWEQKLVINFTLSTENLSF